MLLINIFHSYSYSSAKNRNRFDQVLFFAMTILYIGSFYMLLTFFLFCFGFFLGGGEARVSKNKILAYQVFYFRLTKKAPIYIFVNVEIRVGFKIFCEH